MFIFAKALRRSRKTKYCSEQGYEILVEDPKGFFTESKHLNLARFLDEQLLHDIHDIKCLSRIVIDDYGDNYEDGRWTFLFDKTSGISSGSINLNYFYLKTLEDLKETLAHEYGHHWTIMNCINNHWPEFKATTKVANHKLPSKYFDIRGLDANRYYPDYKFGWYFCDKEIIAEDYRVLFAPEPYNQDHSIVELMADSGLKEYIIEMPKPSVKDYIYKLNTFQN